MRLLPTSKTAFFVEHDATMMASKPDGQAGRLVWDGDEYADLVE